MFRYVILSGALLCGTAWPQNGDNADLGSPNARLASTADTLGDTAQTSADTVRARTSHAKRRPYVGLFASVTFFNLEEKDVLSRNLVTPGGRTLQPFESVHLAFPGGGMGAYPINRYLDVSVMVQGFWYAQTAVFDLPGEETPPPISEERYAVQAWLGGVGAKYLIPKNFLSVTGQPGLYVGYWHFWNLGGSELYTGYGAAPAEFDAGGSGYEIQVGFQHQSSKSWFWNGNIGFQNLHFSSDRTWGDMLGDRGSDATQQPPLDERVEWSLSGLRFGLNLYYQFGKPGSPRGLDREPSRFDTSGQRALFFTHE